MPILPDGTCVPSFVGVRRRGGDPTDSHFNNLAFRHGEVKQIIYSNDPSSISGKFTEYVVEVQHSDGAGPGTSAKYVGCLISDLFGGIADTFQYTLRADDGKMAQDDGIGNGSKVTILCLNGSNNAALIIGGMRDGRTDPSNANASDSPAAGHHMHFCFNGVSADVNKDGEFKLQFLGATDVKGNLDPQATTKVNDSPTTLEITKDGSLELYTKNRNQFLKVDHANHKVSFQADTEWDIKVNGKVVSNVTGSSDYTVGDTCSVAIAKDTKLDVQGGKLDVTASKNVSIKSPGVNIGNASEEFPMFSTYRKAEQTLHQALKIGLNAAGIALSGAASSFTVETAAGVQITTAAQALIQMATAIANFEGQAIRYLSKKNKSD